MVGFGSSLIAAPDLKAHITLCERSSTRSEVRFLGRVLRKVASVRRRVTSDLLARFVAEHLPSSVSADLLSALGEVRGASQMQNQLLSALRPGRKEWRARSRARRLKRT